METDVCRAALIHEIRTATHVSALVGFQATGQVVCDRHYWGRVPHPHHAGLAAPHFTPTDPSPDEDATYPREQRRLPSQSGGRPDRPDGRAASSSPRAPWIARSNESRFQTGSALLLTSGLGLHCASESALLRAIIRSAPMVPPSPPSAPG